MPFSQQLFTFFCDQPLNPIQLNTTKSTAPLHPDSVT